MHNVTNDYYSYFIEPGILLHLERDEVLSFILKLICVFH